MWSQVKKIRYFKIQKTVYIPQYVGGTVIIFFIKILGFFREHKVKESRGRKRGGETSGD